MNTEETILRNRRYEFLLSKKKKTNLNLVQQINEYIENQIGYEIPNDSQERKELISFLVQNGQNEDAELVRLQNYLKIGRSLSSAFLTPNAEITTFTIGHTYNKNRICYIWNFVKERKVRGIYFRWIEKNLELIKTKIPVHIVLTIKRDEEGKFKGQEFYGHLLLNEFNRLRTHPIFDLYCYGGEYGVETKKGKFSKGFHIHIHSFTLLNRKINFERIRKNSKATNKVIHNLLEFYYKAFENKLGNLPKIFPKKRDDSICQLKLVSQKIGTSPKIFEIILRYFWHLKTGANQVHCERLFTKKRNEEGEIEYRYLVNPDKTLKKEIIKEYITINSPSEKICEAILECIKYHFKPDLFHDEFGQFDIPLIGKILYETKRKRLYSRFGEFYKIRELAISFKEDSDDDVEIKVGDINEIPNIIHPESSSKSKFTYSLFCPSNRIHNPKKSIGVSMQSFESNPRIFTFLESDEKISEIFKTICLNKEIRQTSYNLEIQSSIQKIQSILKERKMNNIYEIYSFDENISFLQNLKKLLILLKSNQILFKL